MKVVGGKPTQKNCAICGVDKSLTPEGKLYCLAVRGPKVVYAQWICEECIRLFNTTGWRQTRKSLATLRQKLFGGWI